MREFSLTSNKIPALKNSPRVKSFQNVECQCLQSLDMHGDRCRIDSSDLRSLQSHVEIMSSIFFACLHLYVVLAAEELYIYCILVLFFLPPCNHLKWFPLEASVTLVVLFQVVG